MTTFCAEDYCSDPRGHERKVVQLFPSDLTAALVGAPDTVVAQANARLRNLLASHIEPDAAMRRVVAWVKPAIKTDLLTGPARRE